MSHDQKCALEEINLNAVTIYSLCYLLAFGFIWLTQTITNFDIFTVQIDSNEVMINKWL